MAATTLWAAQQASWSGSQVLINAGSHGVETGAGLGWLVHPQVSVCAAHR